MTSDTERFDGIILRTYPYAEADLILRILSPEGGKRSVIAKSARREKSRFKVNLDVFDNGSFEVKTGRGSLETLVDFRPLKAFPRLRSDIDAFIIGSLLVETCDLIIHEHATSDHPGEARDFYETLSLALRALDEAPATREMLKACYLALHSLLHTAGFGGGSDDAPSVRNLALLIDKVERTAEKDLATKTPVKELLASWEKSARAALLVGREQS